MNTRQDRERRAARKMRDSVKAANEREVANRFDYYDGEEEFLARKRERQLARSDDRIRQAARYHE